MDIKELESFKLSDAVKFHDKLNPALWTDKDKLDPEVEAKLMEIAKDFMAELGLGSLKVSDITISGSNAAYSYTPHSDLDLHILVDFNKLSNDEVYRELFNAKKTVYNDTHDLKVHGVPIELYVQDTNQPHASLGEYSLLNREWIKFPVKRRANFDQAATRLKYEKLGELIELALKQQNLKKIDKVLDIIKRYRKAGLEKAGEFGPENLAFKALRSQGYIQKLYDLKKKLHSKKLSLADDVDEDWHPNDTPPGPEFKPTMPQGTVRVDVSDVYDWYKLGQTISDLSRADKSKFGKGPPSTIMAFGSEEEEHKYIQALKQLGLDTTDIDPVDPRQPKGMPRQKVDPTYNVNEGGWTTGDNPGIKAKMVKQGIAAVNNFLKDFNPWLKKQGQGPVKVGHPTGSAAYHEVDDPEKTIYGDMDLQVIIPDRPEYEDMTSGQIQGRWAALISKFIEDNNLSYIDKTESRGSQPMFILKDGSKMQVDIMPHPVKTSEWGRFRATGEHGLKGLLNGNIFATMSELIPVNLQHKGIQYKTINGKKVSYGKTLKGYELHTIGTDIKRWILDLFLHEAEEQGIKKPKIDPLLKNNPGVDVGDVNIERQVNGVKGFAKSCELNNMFGQSDLAKFSSADDFLNQFVNHYVDKSEHAITAPKRDKASTLASQARAVKDREALARGLEYVKKLFSGEVTGKRYKDYQQVKESDDITENLLQQWNSFLAEDQSAASDIDYYMNEGCGAFAYALWVANGKPDDGDIMIISNVDGEPWFGDPDSEEPTHDFEATHVYYNDPDLGPVDVKGPRSVNQMISDFKIDAKIKGPWSPESFKQEWLGMSDDKPLYFDQSMLQDALKTIKQNSKLYLHTSDTKHQTDFDLSRQNSKKSANESVAEDRGSGYKEIEFVCVNPKFPDATDPVKQKKLYNELKKIEGVIPLLQDWSEYSEGQSSLTAIYKGIETKKKILELVKKLDVKIDLVQPVSDSYVDRAIRGEHEGQIQESASGYIPSNAEKDDPRFRTALTVDIKPDTLKRNARAFGFDIARSGIPPQLRANGKYKKIGTR